MYIGALLLCLCALAASQSCKNGNRPCRNGNPRQCSPISSSTVCPGEALVLAAEGNNLAGTLYHSRHTSGATLYVCCGDDCACSGDSCITNGLWTVAESIPSFVKRAREYDPSKKDLDERGWIVSDASLVADQSLDQCHFSFFWCRDCARSNPSPQCGGRQSPLCGGSASGQPLCSAESSCTPGCQGEANWVTNNPLDHATTLRIKPAVASPPVDRSGVVGSSVSFSAEFFRECGYTKTQWMTCGASGDCGVGDGVVVPTSGAYQVTTSVIDSERLSSTLNIDPISSDMNGHRYYAIACPSSCAVCDKDCVGAFSSTPAVISVCSAPAPDPIMQENPSSQSSIVGGTITLTSRATGADFSSWERRVPGGNWLPFMSGTSSVSGGVRTASLTFSPSDDSFDRNEIRAVFSSCGSASQSSAAVLCVRYPPCMFQLNDLTVNKGFNGTVCAAHASGSNTNACPDGTSTVIGGPPCDPNPPDSTVWQLSDDGGSSWSDLNFGTVTGLPLSAGGATYVTIPGQYVGANQNWFPRLRVRASNCVTSTTTPLSKMTISCPTSGIRRQKVVEGLNDVSLTVGDPLILTAKADEDPQHSYVDDARWEYSPDGGVRWGLIGRVGTTGDWTVSLSGPVSTLTHTGVTSDMNGWIFRMRFCNCDTGSSCTTGYPDSSSDTATLTLACPAQTCAPIPQTNPQDVRTVSGSDAVFSATASGAVDSVLWQMFDFDSNSWVPASFTNFEVTGTSSTSLIIRDTTLDDDNTAVRVRFRNSFGDSFTFYAFLGVTTLSSTCSAEAQACGTSDLYAETPEDCGSSGPGCSFQCSGCGSCTAVLNPEFSKQCEASIVLVLDESGSISSYAGDVRNGVKQFLLSFSQTTTLGGVANLGVVEFNTRARLVTTSGNQGRMAPLTATWTNSLIAYLDNDSGSNSLGYSPAGCTNWGEAVQLALRPSGASSSWQVNNGGSWTDQNPDVVIIFTDGAPTHHQQNTCNYHCNYARVKPDGNIVGPCNGGDIGWSCFNSDIIKSAGVKLFLVGVGSVSGNVDTVQLLTGPRAWDLKSDTFYNADYVINADYAALGNIFLEVVRGLCTCLQNVPSCQGSVSQCSATQFSARVRVTTTANRTTDRTTFPAGAETSAYIYYNYVASPDTKVGYQFFQPGTDVTEASPNLVRTDVLDPCTVRREVKCGGACYSVSERQDLPRFFREATDTRDLSGAFWPMPSGCREGFRKNYPSPPYVDVSPSMIQFLYVMSDGVTPCAAEAFDQTLFEFFSDEGVSRGVNDLGSVPQVLQPNELPVGDFSFEFNSSCAAATCGRDVELVFVVDESAAVTLNDYENMLRFVAKTILTFDLNSNGVRFGIVFSNPASDADPFPESLQPGGVSIITQILFPGSSLETFESSFPRARARGDADFAARILFAADKYWPSPSTNGIPRVLVSLVASQDAGTSASRFSSLNSTLKERGIEAFALGVGDIGAYNLGLLSDISSKSTNFLHYQSFASSQFLVDQTNFVAPLFCPQGNLCGSSCAGFCGCATVDTCECPVCKSTVCNPRECPGPGSGCVSLASTTECPDDGLGACTSKECIDPIIGCQYPPLIVCDDGNNCTLDRCRSGACEYAPRNVEDGNLCTIGECLPDGTIVQNPVQCPVSNACFMYSCNASTGACDLSTPLCDDGDICTENSCDNSTGCVYSPLSDVSSVCAPRSCKTASCPVGTNACSYSDIDTSECACELYPCTNFTFCSTPVCLNSNELCESLSESSLVAACTAAVSSGSPKRFCFDEPSNPCARSNECYSVRCENDVGLAGSCVSAFTGGRCTADLCSTPFCNNQTGCQTAPKSPEAIAALCDDGNACTRDSCSNGACVYTNTSSDCTTSDKCLVAFCDPEAGCATRSKTPEELLTVCNDNNACTTDTCESDTCIYTTSVTCPVDDACDSYVCNAATGECDKTTIVCDDQNECTIDSCNNVTGCVYRQRTQDEINSLCKPGSCEVATCVNECVLAPPDPLPAVCSDDPCVRAPCPGSVDNFCFLDVCINSQSGNGITCDSIPDAIEKASCYDNITNSDRYCYQLAKSPCPANTQCTNYTCNPSGSGSCDVTDLGASCVSNDICKKPTCNAATGCGLVDKSASEIALLCDDGNACTTDTCSNNECVYTPVTCATPSDKCLEATCDPATGCGTKPKNATAIAALCNDNTLCTTDTCVNNECVYTRSVTCPASDACKQYECNALTGVCDLTKTVCNDQNECTIDSCNNVTGCVYRQRTQTEINALCNPRSCEQATCVTGCVNAPIVPTPPACNSDPCIRDPCPVYVNTFCERTVCINQPSGTSGNTCDMVPAGAQRDECVANTTATPQVQRYCYLQPLTPCPANTQCTNYTCNPAGLGSCDALDLGASCPSNDICKKPTCNAATGCGLVDKSGAEIAALCNDNNKCTIDTCSGNACRYTNVTCPQPSDKCQEAFCDPVNGCGTRKKSAAAIAALCNDNNNCTSDDCVSNQCVYTSVVSCPTTTACRAYSCNPVTAVCDETVTQCNDTDICTADSCDATQGCRYRNLTQTEINTLCRPQTCQIATCVRGSNKCERLPDPSAACACQNYPCSNNATFCTTPQCINSVAGCDVLPVAERPACVASVQASTAPRRYCANIATKPCPPNTQCKRYTCNPAGTGSCDEEDLGASCPSNDICKRAVCDDNLGCLEVDKSASEIALLCDDGNACTTDTCSNNQCVYTPVTCATPSDKCLEATCDTSTGCGTKPKNATAIAALCNDNTLCTTDTCVNNECVYTPSVTCPVDTACATYTCNATTGACDVQRPVCDDNDRCTKDSCDAAIGCVYEARTQAEINSICGTAACKIASCVADVCSLNSDSAASCACQEYPCTNNATFCTTPRCISTSAGCAGLATDAARQACLADLVSVPRRHCADVPKSAVCPVDTQCATYSCNITAGKCDMQDLGAACMSDDICKRPSCNAATGCIKIDKTASEIATLCNDNNKCTTDSCANNACVYTNVTCSTSDICSVPVCNPATGCGTRPKSAAEIALICNDNNACTTDTCENGACKYTPSVFCPQSNACNQYVCNKTTGVCDETVTVCDDGDKCTEDSCDIATGCVYKQLTQTQVNSLCNPGNCKQATCAAGTDQCVISSDLSARCACIEFPCSNLATFCTTPVCVSSTTASPGTTSCADLPLANQSACTAAVTSGTPKRFCYDRPRSGVCRPNNLCSTFKCVNDLVDPTQGLCAEDRSQASACTSTNRCQEPRCDPNLGCLVVNKTSSAIAALCDDQQACTQDTCDPIKDECVHTPIVTGLCGGCRAGSCSSSNACAPSVCYDNCDLATVVDKVACRAARLAEGFYCQTENVTCPASNVCESWSCNATLGCVRTPTVCAGSPCNQGQCILALGGCVYRDPCLNVAIPDKCAEPRCAEVPGSVNGYTCYDVTNPKIKNCTDYVCWSDSVERTIIVGGKEAVAFLSEQRAVGQNPVCEEIICTADSCTDSFKGCENINLKCSVPALSCNASLGCFEEDNIYDYPPGVCINIIVQSLFDFCGVCRGDSTDCFFSSINSVPVIAGISAGVAAGIAVAAIVAAAILFYLSKKTYDHYKARSDAAAAGAHSNPYYLENQNIGVMPEMS